MAQRRRTGAVMALIATSLLATSACSKGETPSGDELYQNPVTLTWWHNASQDGPLKTYFQKVADDFHTLHPTVTFKIEAVETNELQRTRIPAALLTSSPPDIFAAWGGGEIVDQAAAGSVKDITEQTKTKVTNIGGSAGIWAVDGKQYGLPYRMGIEGFWYNKAMFTQAGISAPPTTLAELNAAVAKLKAINVVPIAVGAGDKWPAAHYWYNFALRNCSVDTLRKAGADQVFDDPCFVQAGSDLKAFIDTQPFQPDFIATPAQQGAGSSAGMIANRKAAMELMGDWNKGVMESLTDDRKGLGSDLGWFPFPATTGAGDPKAALGGGDGFACSKNAPAECVEFLKFLVSPEQQKAYAATGAGIPVIKDAASGLTDPVLGSILTATTNASYVQLWLDTTYGSTVGTAMNDGIVGIFAGTGTAQDVVDKMKAAAQK